MKVQGGPGNTGSSIIPVVSGSPINRLGGGGLNTHLKPGSKQPASPLPPRDTPLHLPPTQLLRPPTWLQALPPDLPHQNDPLLPHLSTEQFPAASLRAAISPLSGLTMSLWDHVAPQASGQGQASHPCCPRQIQRLRLHRRQGWESALPCHPHKTARQPPRPLTPLHPHHSWFAKVTYLITK